MLEKSALEFVVDGIDDLLEKVFGNRLTDVNYSALLLAEAIHCRLEKVIVRAHTKSGQFQSRLVDNVDHLAGQSCPPALQNVGDFALVTVTAGHLAVFALQSNAIYLVVEGDAHLRKA